MFKHLLMGVAVALTMTATTAYAQKDSTGQGGNAPRIYGDVLASTTWERVQNKPLVFPPEPHHHDSRYVKRGERLVGAVIGGGSKKSNAKATAWGAATVSGNHWVGSIECPSGSRKVRTGHTVATTRKTTTPGCDGGCEHTSTTPSETFWLCIATGASGAPVGHAESPGFRQGVLD